MLQENKPALISDAVLAAEGWLPMLPEMADISRGYSH